MIMKTKPKHKVKSLKERLLGTPVLRRTGALIMLALNSGVLIMQMILTAMVSGIFLFAALPSLVGLVLSALVYYLESDDEEHELTKKMEKSKHESI